MKQEHRGNAVAAVVVGAMVTAALFVGASAQQPQAYQAMLNDYRTLEGSVAAMSGALEHFKASLQAALDQMVKDQQKAAADLKAADERLAWVLDNWLPKVKP